MVGGTNAAVSGKVITSSGSTWGWSVATGGIRLDGKYYAELVFGQLAVNTTVAFWGVVDNDLNVATSGGIAGNSGLNNGCAKRTATGAIEVNGTDWAIGAGSFPAHTFANGNILQVAIEITGGNVRVWLGVNNSWTGDPAAGTNRSADRTGIDQGVSIVGVIFGATNNLTLRTKQTEMTYSPPSGFTALDDADTDDADAWIAPAGGVMQHLGAGVNLAGSVRGSGRFSGHRNSMGAGLSTRFILPSGRALFTTNSRNITVNVKKHVRLTLETTIAGGRYFDVMVNGTKNTTVDMGSTGLENLTVSSTIDFGSVASRDIELVFPYSGSLDLLGVGIDSGSTIAATTGLPTVTAVCFGDSITQGIGANDASGTYPYLLAAAKGWNVINEGYGSRSLVASDGTALGNVTADVYIVMFGYNHFLAQQAAATFRTALDNFIANFRALQPTAKLYMCSTIGAQSESGTIPLSTYRTQVSDAVTAADDANTVYILGTDLLTYSAGDYSDAIHPDSSGYLEMATNMAPLVSFGGGGGGGSGSYQNLPLLGVG